jgi:2-dehydropantoate 2-reductase
MKISVIGSGAMGCLFGGLLTEAGQEVQLLDIWPEHVRALNEKGLSILRDGKERVIRVRATTDPAEIKETDLALIFVKHSQTKEAAGIAEGLLGKRGYILSLQNGMGNAEIIAKTAGSEQIVCGTTAQGAMLLEPGRIQHSGIGKTIIGMWDRPRQPIMARVAEVFTTAKIETSCEDDIKPVIWSKLFANVGINAVTALTGIRNGQLLDLEPTRQLVEAAVKEAVGVAAALQIAVDGDVLNNVLSIAEATASNRSSMGQDVDAHRPTEIDAINGYIVKRAKELGLEVPVNEALTRLIKTLQTHY